MFLSILKGIFENKASLIFRTRVIRDGRGVHGSMFLAIDGDITAAEARFLGRLAGAGSCGGGKRERKSRGGKRKGGWGTRR